MLEDMMLGGYRRVNVMQTGQNSEVWEVAEPGSGKRFAMKLLLPERMDDPDQIRMLKHESAVGAELKHPKIIRFYGLKKDKKYKFILMEYFPSMNLKLRMLRKGHYEEFIRPNLRPILEQACQALEFMHSKRWVHRDVKPDNLLVNANVEVRLIDFGLAVRPSGFFAGFGSKNRRTAGTRSYMSPEQIRGKTIDTRADIYSLGVMLYEIVAGKLPYTASTAMELLQKHIHGTVPTIEKDRKVTPEFEQFLQKMLAKNPKDRPATMGDVISRLRGTKIFKDELQANANAAAGIG